MNWELQLLIVIMSIFRMEGDINAKNRMLEFARRDFGIPKENFNSIMSMLKQETLLANLRYISYNDELLKES